MDDPCHPSLCSFADVDGAAGDGGSGRYSTKERKDDVADALSHEFFVALMSVTA